MADNEFVLKGEGINKSYKSEQGEARLEVLKNVSLEIKKGSITAIVGSSGSGKSTLLHILGGLDKPDSGAVYWGDQLISSMNSDQLADFRNENIGFVFQFHHLLPEFTALENVSMPALISGMSIEDSSKRALQLLERFGVADRRNHRPTQLSGGEQQRVSMARALMNKPSIILADEPTGNLDDSNTSTILDMLFELRKQDDVTVLLITHEKAIAQRSDIVLEIKNGELSSL
ncbi:MAG: ABC transporter ATP-binding protein [Balneolaceae bacterium]|nr:ABC transporter ATP-binding protein [Balneolaceae bacterium]MBO6546415.1 ABC transporter ATP-binding protein [Balneolaceae bacterium]MBO6648774.1 ABC transporter ATP-binding protein [Balneolaceae bacterium]